MFKVNNKNCRRRSVVFIVNFKHILHLCVSIVEFEQVNVCWVVSFAYIQYSFLVISSIYLLAGRWKYKDSCLQMLDRKAVLKY